MHIESMDYIGIYKCLCDTTRLRILNLLQEGPLCVCHIHHILQEPQAKISKQLAYLKRHGLVDCKRHNNWSIYSLTQEKNSLLEQNLACLQDIAFNDSVYQQDIATLKTTDTSAAIYAGQPNEPDCCCGDAPRLESASK